MASQWSGYEVLQWGWGRGTGHKTLVDQVEDEMVGYDRMRRK